MPELNQCLYKKWHSTLSVFFAVTSATRCKSSSHLIARVLTLYKRLCLLLFARGGAVPARSAQPARAARPVSRCRCPCAAGAFHLQPDELHLVTFCVTGKKTFPEVLKYPG